MILNDATRRQIEAADPLRSTWLSANAGSGKTRVLTDRVARLLLADTPPENILCLTYTKAAASEMQNRLFQRLGEWAMMEPAKLREELKALGITATLDGAFLSRARTLFASAIEAPGGLKIQTIHSFCSGVLRRFPLEAGVSPQFKEMEDRAAQLLREEVLDAMAVGPDADALRAFANHYTGAEVDRFLTALTGRKAAFAKVPTEKELNQQFGLPDSASVEDATGIAFIGGEADLVDDIVDAFAGATKSYQTFAANLKAIDLTAPDLGTLRAVRKLLLYADQTSKSRNWPQSNHKAAVEAIAHIVDDVHAWMDRVAEAFDYLKLIEARDKTHALYTFAVPFIAAYEKRKVQRGALDFDDLIGKAKTLLEDPNVAQWVLFRLDGGVDHVLVDEAQDTSPDQWDIVRLLTQEFSTGEGANPDRERTVFVVGDKKQSIYSFQGADPEGFDRMRHHFASELSNVQKTLQDTELQFSFRSSPAILQLVDQVFTGEMADGLGDHIQHLAFKDDMPGRVDLWPVVEKAEKEDDREWDDPVDLKGKTNHQVILARTIAQDIKRMIQEETLPHKGKDETEWSRRPITPGDILILVQSRTNGMFEEVIAACKREELDVAGADRLKLGGELAVKDITALLRFLALQDDDLSLAAALKSPLFGWTEKDLYRLAQPRPKGQSLWEALRKAAGHEGTLAILDDLRRQSDFLRPYDLITRLLVRHGGRKALLARPGHEAEDGIDALLSQALGYENASVPSLTGFIGWLQAEDVTVKRQMDTAGDRIRVMTVHGAKGLEAPIVILPDTTKRKREVKGDLLIDQENVFWKPKSEAMPTALDAVKENMLAAQDRERRRLLYVALTRAENWLIVAAAGDVGKEPTDSWHGTTAQAMEHLDAVDMITPLGVGKRFARHDWNDGEITVKAQSEPAPSAEPAFGDTLPPIPTRATTLSPSNLGGAKILPGETHDDESEAALAWGRVIHLLLEILPPLPPMERKEVARQTLANHPDRGSIDDEDGLLEEVEAILSDASLAWMFEAGLTEVPITAHTPHLGSDRLYGLIDRLIVTDEDVIAIDYKSNRAAPALPDDTPLGLKRQMTAYRDALRLIYPNHRIRSLLLWTRTRAVTELSDDILDAALEGVTVP